MDDAAYQSEQTIAALYVEGVPAALALPRDGSPRRCRLPPPPGRARRTRRGEAVTAATVYPPEEDLVLDEYAKCGNCLRAVEHHPSDPFEVVNRATRVRHIGADFGMTLCGKDATHDQWWWKW